MTDPHLPPSAGPTAATPRECFALVYAPSRRRQRFAENCVEEHPSAESAFTAADPARGLRAARLVGPSRSSEGFRLYYLVEWLR